MKLWYWVATRLHSIQCFKVSWLCVALCWWLFDEFTTQQPVSDRKQLHRHRKWGVWVPLWDTIDNLMATEVVWTKGHSPQGILDHLQLSFVCFLLKIPIFWTPFMGFLPSIAALSSSKPFLLVFLWMSHFWFFYNREQLWGNQQKEQLVIECYACSTKGYGNKHYTNNLWIKKNEERFTMAVMSYQRT